jgi:hypothetical protein
MALLPTQAPADATTPQGDRASEPPLAGARLGCLRHADAARRAHLWAAGLAAGAGLVHALAGEGHFSAWWGYGLFFLAVSICQLVGGAALLFWSDRRLYRTGIGGTAIVLLIWAISRTVGVPIGPDGAGPEPIGALDGISVALEVALIWYLIQLLRHPGRAPLEGVLGDADDADDAAPHEPHEPRGA